MNTKKIGKEFEREAFEILKEKFDKVKWLSERNSKSSYDFECVKDGKTYFGEAKFTNTGDKVFLSGSQKEADFVIAKIKGKVFFILKEDFLDFVGIIKRPPFIVIKIEQETARKLNGIKYTWGMKTQSEVIRRLIEIASKFQTADEYSKSKKVKEK